MASMLSTVSAYFWHESVWLPPGTNWRVARDTRLTHRESSLLLPRRTSIPPHQFTDFRLMYQSIPLAFVFIAVRIAFEWCGSDENVNWCTKTRCNARIAG